MSEVKDLEPDSPEYIKRCQEDPEFRARHFGPLFGSAESRSILERFIQFTGEVFEEEGYSGRAYLFGGMWGLVRDMEAKLKELGAGDFLAVGGGEAKDLPKPPLSAQRDIVDYFETALVQCDDMDKATYQRLLAQSKDVLGFLGGLKS